MDACSITKELEEALPSCDRRVLRYMTVVSLADTSVKVTSSSAVKPLTSVMCESRMLCYGDVKRQQGDGEQGEVMEMEVTSTKPRGSPQKNWMKNFEET